VVCYREAAWIILFSTLVVPSRACVSSPNVTGRASKRSGAYEDKAYPEMTVNMGRPIQSGDDKE
jgi:hypothetical protein